MCLVRKPTAVLPWSAPSPSMQPVVVHIPDHIASGTEQRPRRRRLWELSAHAACPVLGVCVPMGLLRQLMNKAKWDTLQRSDYDLHTIAVSECRRRSPLAEGIQRALEERFALELRQVQHLRGSDALLEHWQAALMRSDWAAALWAVLTHADMSSALEYQLLGEVHMLQHQVGMSARVDKRQVDDSRQAQRELRRQAEAAQERLQTQTREWAERIEAQEQELARMRAELVRQVQCTQSARAELQALQQRIPELDSREKLSEHNVQLQTQLQEQQGLVRQLQRALEQRSHERDAWDASSQPGQSERTEGAATPPSACQWMVAPTAALEKLAERRILCIGGRAAHVPIYRSLVQAHGAAFLHHDGGQEDSLTQLPASLAAADVVICQVACISHNAYWRVKEHCKRTGTPCAFVDSPSRSALERTLEAMTSAAL